MSTEVIPIYREGEVKLRKALKDVCLKDHEWDFKSYNCHGKAIVVLNYWECKKILEGLMNNIQRREFQIFFPISKKVTS